MPAPQLVFTIAVAILTLFLALPVAAQDRDSDGTRMQARPVDVGSVHQDTLSPPSDRADWRMIRLEEETTLSLELTVRPNNRSATLTLTGSTGNELASEQADRRSAKIETSLEAGIYYIAVESSQSLRYELNIGTP